MGNNSININKPTHTSHPQPIEHKKQTTRYDIGNPGSALEQACKCGGVKPVNWIPTPLLINSS